MKLYYDVRNSGVPNHASVKRQVLSDLRCDVWDAYLQDYHDQDIMKFLRYGWPVKYIADQPPLQTLNNHASALRNRPAIDAFVQKELRMNAMLGPLTTQPFVEWTQVPPLMTRDKPDGSGKRVIIDLSFPEGRSVNDGISKVETPTYKLPTPLDLADHILEAGRGALLWKSDLSRAYRQLRVDPLDYPLLCIKHDGAYYVDICPSFGCRASGQAQQRVSNAVFHLMSRENFNVLAYVDDFCGVARHPQTAKASFDRFQSLTRELGLKLAPDKTQTPSTVMEWLGFTFDTNDMSITIPQEKLDDILQEAEKWLHKSSATKQQIQSLAGRLNHVSLCIRPARRFMGRILAALREAHHQTSVPISADFKRDVRWFCEFASLTNRRLLIEPRIPVMTIECDACPLGGGGFLKDSFYDFEFPPKLSETHNISQLEALNLVVTVKTLIPPSVSHARLLVKTDNMGAKWALSTGRTRDPILGACARELWLISAVQSLDILIHHAPGESLVLADALSRASFDRHMHRLAGTLVNQKNLSRVAPVPLSTALTMFL